jgi:hypothetical protein
MSSTLLRDETLRHQLPTYDWRDVASDPFKPGFGCRDVHTFRRDSACKSLWADLFEMSRRRTWPFHIQSPERSRAGRKT